MDKLERHSYQKVDDEWKIIKTDILWYERVPYNISTILGLSQKLKQVLTPDLLTKKYRAKNETNPILILWWTRTSSHPKDKQNHG